jgi:hypothetical protein
MANYRGEDGSATVATNAVGELKAWSLDGVAIELIEDTVKGDKHKTYLGGQGDGGTASLSCQLDGGDTGQATIIAYFAAATPQSAGVAVVLTVNTGKTFSFSAVPTTMSLSSPEGSAVDMATFNFKVSGAVTMSWA